MAIVTKEGRSRFIRNAPRNGPGGLGGDPNRGLGYGISDWGFTSNVESAGLLDTAAVELLQDHVAGSPEAMTLRLIEQGATVAAKEPCTYEEGKADAREGKKTRKSDPLYLRGFADGLRGKMRVE
jgi:hypothetical protein